MIAALLLACGPLPEPECLVEQGLPVFPGAEGFGTTTPAGRGGAVLTVTSLADDGPGTLRAAIEASGPRTVVFRVAGAIELERHLEVTEPFLTVSGQTAPGDGVVLTGAGVVVFTHDVLFEHLRVRPGLGPVDPEVNDAFQVLGVDSGSGLDAHHVVLDHLSLSWSEDEVFSTLFAPHDLTLSWSVVSEALDEGRHPKGHHSAGVLIGDGSSCVSVHHALLAHDSFRNPLLSGGGRIDWRNVLAYDWGELAAELEPRGSPMDVNLVGNAWIPGPSSVEPFTATVSVHHDHPFLYTDAPEHLLAAGGRVRVFAVDNEAPAGPLLSEGFSFDPVPADTLVGAAFDAPPVTTVPSADLMDALLPAVGATRPTRDPVDVRIVDEVRSGTGQIPDRPSDVGGDWVPAPAEAPPDTDGDGLPDDWEVLAGTDPADPSDAVHDPDGDGYTNLEDWLDSLR